MSPGRWKPNLGFWLRHPLVAWYWHYWCSIHAEPKKAADNQGKKR